MTRLGYFLLFLTLKIFETRCRKVVLRTGETTGDIVVKYLPNVDEEIKELTKVVQELKDSPKGKAFQGIKVLPKRNEETKVAPELVGVNIETEVEGSKNLLQVAGINNLPKPADGSQYSPKVETINNVPKPVVELKEQPKENVGNIQMETQISFIQPNKAPEVLNQQKVPEKQKKVGRKKHRITKEILSQIGGNTDFIETKKRKIEEMKNKVAKIRNQLKADKKDNNIGTKDDKHPVMRTNNKDKTSRHAKKRKHKAKLLRSRFAIETKTEKTTSPIITSYSPVTRKKADSDDDDEPVMRGESGLADDDDLNFDLDGDMLSQIV